MQRREEIRELIAEIARYEELGATLDLESKARDAITELLAHIDTLEQTAAERVIARGAVVKPHTFGEIVNQVRDIAAKYAGTEQLREQIAYALAPLFERDAGPTPDYTGEGSAWVPPVEERGVAVPEISFAKIELGFGRVEVGEGTWMDVPALIFGKNGNGVVGKPTEAGSRFLGVDECLAVVTFANVESLDVVLGKLMKCRSDRFPDAIPADRLPGEGMVAVDRRIIEKFTTGCHEWMPGLGRCGDQYPGEERQLCSKCAPLRAALRANQGGAAT